MASVNGSYVPPKWWKRCVLAWEILIVYYWWKNKINLDSALREFTTWTLPGGFKLQYVDWSKSWSIDRLEEVNYPFMTTYVNSVYCIKGPIYFLFAHFMRKEAAKIRGISDYKNLETERKKIVVKEGALFQKICKFLEEIEHSENCEKL
jgi:hypothetical protein